MTGMVFIKCLLLVVMIARTEGWKSKIARTEGWKSTDPSVSEKILKTILKSCHENNSFPNPVVIFGDFNPFIDEVSIIQINDSLDAEDYKVNGSLKFKASSIVLVEEPSEKLIPHLELLSKTKLWDSTIPFFIIGNNTASCQNSSSILNAMWTMEILNSIYICAKSIDNTSEIYTLNPITNYAPYPWETFEELDDLTVFRQNFDANISCMHLTYDKTKILDGYDIIVVHSQAAGLDWIYEMDYSEAITKLRGIEPRVIQTTIRALNASGCLEMAGGMRAMKRRYVKGTADIMLSSFPMDAFKDFPYLFPHREADEVVAVVKLKGEVSTLDKICRLWSTPVMIAAGFAIAVLFLVLTIKNWSFSAALLDLTRLLTYTSIQTDNRSQSFRIYFTTMLIFMVISNGVFQGKIAAFLTTRERNNAAESIHELVEMGYEIYTAQAYLPKAKTVCPACKLKTVSTHDHCIELLLDSPKHICLMGKMLYETDYILLPLDLVREPSNPLFNNFKSRKNWPLHDRFNRMMMSVVESGLNDFWKMELSSIPKAKRRSMEAEWSSREYRPVTPIKLAFAFQLLAAGLSLAIIVFCLELCWTRYRAL